MDELYGRNVSRNSSEMDEEDQNKKVIMVHRKHDRLRLEILCRDLIVAASVLLHRTEEGFWGKHFCELRKSPPKVLDSR